MLANSGGLKDLHGEPLPIETLSGKVVLIVNVASRCGLTPQYAGLVRLQKVLAKHDFTVLGVPCNRFGQQEPGTPSQIQTFCDTKYGVNFPLLEKQNVNVENRSPLYDYLIRSTPGSIKDIEWNFAKFLLGRDGTVVARFGSNVAPEDPRLKQAIKNALAT